jgi:hypothetical protein
MGTTSQYHDAIADESTIPKMPVINSQKALVQSQSTERQIPDPVTSSPFAV